jgi:methyl-accepting chemotaxis protein
MGFQAVDMMLAQLLGEPISPQETVPMKLIVRQSCGCLEPIVVEAAAGVIEKADESYETVFTERRESLVADILHVVQDHNESLKRDWITQLLDSFSPEIASETTHVFLSVLEDILHQVAMAGGDVGSWQGAISVLRRYALPCCGNEQLLRHAENLWGQARIMIDGIARQMQESRRLQAERQAQSLSEIGQELITTFDQDKLKQVLTRELPLLGIPGGYLALYETPDDPTAWAQLILAYHEQGRIDIASKEQRFPSSQLLPAGMKSREHPLHAVIEPLYFREQQIGFVILEAGSREGDIYETLRAQLSSALKGAQLLQQHVHAQDILALQPVMQQMVSVGEQLGNASNDLLQISEHMAIGAEETSRQALVVSSNSQQINQIIHEMSSATQKEGTGVQKISNSVEKVTEIVATAMEIAHASNTIMVNLKTYSQQIGDIVKTVTGIAKRTKFLSLYAAIEAAKAGDFGQGFAVVANEVKKLAQETSDSAKDIAAKLEMIRHSGQDAAESIDSVVDIVGQVSDLSQIIAAAVGQQTETTDEIAVEMSNAVDGTDEITQAMRDVAIAAQESAERAEQVQREAQELSALAMQLRRLVDDVHL